MAEAKSLYLQLVDAGISPQNIDHHASDLYVTVSPMTKSIVEKFCAETGRPKPSVFKSLETPSRLTYDIPFAYDPFWDEAQATSRPDKEIPASPYYSLQRDYAASGRLGIFIDALDSMECKALPVPMKNGRANVVSVSVASFLLGFCGHLAKYWAREHGFPICVLFDGTELVHAFNIATTQDGRAVFLDARGATLNLEEFLSPFSRQYLRLDMNGESSVEQVPDWVFPEDEYSEAMISWLLRRKPCCYDFSCLCVPSPDYTVNLKEVFTT